MKHPAPTMRKVETGSLTTRAGNRVATSAGTAVGRDETEGWGKAVLPVELDALDRSLIEHLRSDGRIGNRALAASLDVNEVTVAARLRRMEEADVMRVVAVTDIRLFGHREFAFLMVEVAGRPVHDVASDLAKLPESIGVTICTGRFDIVVPILGRDRPHLAELFGSVVPQIEGVSVAHGSIALDVKKYDSRWALFGVDPGTAPHARPSETIDRMDLSIIEELQHNARRSNRQIASDLGVSEGTVRGRIKRMLSERVFRIQAVTSIMVSGVGAHAYLLVRSAPGRAEEVAAALTERDEVAQVTRVLDGFDLVALLHSSDRAALISSIFEDVAHISGVVRVETLDGIASLKHSYAWTWIV